MECCSTETSSSSCGDIGRSRKFLTKEEKVDMLKDYQDVLEKEAKGVSEKISRLQKD